MMDIEVAPWLASLPLAPVFHPSEEEFVDPIAYILKIEKEASQFGICKIVPPFSRAAEDTVFSNLNVSLAATQDPIPAFTSAGGIPSVPLSRSMCGAVGDGDARVVVAARNLDSPAKFTTRRQQLGWNPRRPRAGSQYRAQKLVWESGEYYTVEQFEEKAKTFSSALLGSGEEMNPLVVETLFWNAEFAKPISIEYANDIPGSAFIDPSSSGAGCSGLELARSRWNVRNIARSHGSLLKFISNEVPGVTTPMVYLGMLFSWFAWHVEDHELHSLNYLHAGARKTWYAVPSDAAPALEEVIRLYGYGSRLKPRAAFTLLGEKTTILSPEILAAAGVPCCRLVQDPGEYVITFPRAYHLGFSHGFNCGEAANFATPAWLELAREAAARRASMSHLPMLAHEQLLYLFTMSLPKMLPLENSEATSHVEHSVKSAFFNELKQNNFVISKLLELGAEACVFIRTAEPPKEQPAAENKLPETEEEGPAKPAPIEPPCVVESKAPSANRYEIETEHGRVARLPTPWGSLPCAACGILCFATMALVQPNPASLLSSRQRKQKPATEPSAEPPAEAVVNQAEIPKADPSPAPAELYSGLCQFNSADAAQCDMLPETSSLSDDNVADTEPSPQTTAEDESVQPDSSHRSSLELLAEAYKCDSEDECEQCEPDSPEEDEAVVGGVCAEAPCKAVRENIGTAGSEREPGGAADLKPLPELVASDGLLAGDEPVLPVKTDQGADLTAASSEPVCSFNCESSNAFSAEKEEDCVVAAGTEAATVAAEVKEELPPCVSNNIPSPDASNNIPSPDADVLKTGCSMSFMKGSARPYVFCLEHALEAVSELETSCGASVLIICHPNYEVMQQRAKDLAEELKFPHAWDQIPLREASEEEVDIINRSIHLKIDNSPGVNWWAKTGLGCRKLKKWSGSSSPGVDIIKSDPQETKKDGGNAEAEAQAPLGVSTTKCEAEKKPVLGKWCGKQWKASQVHPLLGGGKRSAHLLGQMVRRCELQKRVLPLKIRNAFAGFPTFSPATSPAEGPLKKLKKEGWDPQERVLTAAILRKSKRNAAARDGTRKRIKFDGIQARLQQTTSTLTQYGLCRQAVFATECNTNQAPEDDDQGGTKETQRQALSNPASSSTTGTSCQKNSNTQSDLDSAAVVKWHEVPVSCSASLRPAMQVYSEWSSDQTGICSTSQQDTGFDEMQAWDLVSDQSKKLVLRFKRKLVNSPIPFKRRKREKACEELKKMTDDSPESYSGQCETTSPVDYNCAQSVEERREIDEGGESGSEYDEYSLRTGSGSDSSPPKALPSFGKSKKRSASKSRVKRATWDTLLNRLTVAPQHKEQGVALLNQDSFPLSCVTETGWDGVEGTGVAVRAKQEASGGGRQKTKRGGRGAAAAAAGLDAGAGAGVEKICGEDLDDTNKPFPCDIEGCSMRFNSEVELGLHKKNRCTIKGCGKRFFSHKYLVQHRRVHVDDRPLKCPWEGCSMSFKWAWARTEHIRVHTGERPYACPDCDKTFRFVSDFSRHKRNTGHARA